MTGPVTLGVLVSLLQLLPVDLPEMVELQPLHLQHLNELGLHGRKLMPAFRNTSDLLFVDICACCMLSIYVPCDFISNIHTSYIFLLHLPCF